MGKSKTGMVVAVVCAVAAVVAGCSSKRSVVTADRDTLSVTGGINGVARRLRVDSITYNWDVVLDSLKIEDDATRGVARVTAARAIVSAKRGRRNVEMAEDSIWGVLTAKRDKTVSSSEKSETEAARPRNGFLAGVVGALLLLLFVKRKKD